MSKSMACLRGLKTALVALFILVPGVALSNGVDTNVELAFASGEKITKEAQAERDEIYTLLAYAVVLKDWQTDQTEKRRGHNIGSVLVDEDGAVVCWARNSNAITDNATQHGEVRLISSFLSSSEFSYLRDFVIYTTLEPCAMCSGMMTLTNLKRTVWGQHDPGYGDALERLQYDSSKDPHGYKPYPRKVISEGSTTEYRKRLDAQYAKDKDSVGGITTWLRTPQAKAIFEDAAKALGTFSVKYPDENAKVLKGAQSFLGFVPDHYVPLGTQYQCAPSP